MSTDGDHDPDGTDPLAKTVLLTQLLPKSDVNTPKPAEEPATNQPSPAQAETVPDPEATVFMTQLAPQDHDQPVEAEATVIGQTSAAKPITVRLVEPGTLINNNYRILSLVSAGGMGEVYRAENVFTGDPVAVKVILPDLAQDESVLNLFRSEARVLVQLRDEAIVRYHNFILDGQLGRYCLIMEFVEGRHLGTRLSEDGPLPDDGAIALMRRLAGGLQCAHERGVTHRDLSPDNVILRSDNIDQAVLIDFGIARSTEFGDGLAGRFAGKFKYIAPEQLGHSGGETGPRTDIYGLALLIATVARGKPLPMGDSVVSASAARQAIPDLSGISHRLFPLLQHMLEPDPQRRPTDMDAVLRILRDPALLPAQYRLPLWPGHAESGVSDSDDTSVATVVSQSPADTSSSSPFSVAPGHYAPGSPAKAAATSRPAGGKRWLGGIAGLAVAAIAAASGWWLMRTEPVADPDPVEPAPVSVMVARDPTTREGFLASQSLSDCSFAYRITTGPDAGMIAILSDAGIDSAGLLTGYEQQFGVRPDSTATRVTADQCAILQLLHEVSGRPATPPDLSAAATPTAAGFQLMGNVDWDRARNLWLFLVSPSGGVYDLTGQGTDTNTGLGFAVSISAEAGQQQTTDATYLLVALTTDRPIPAVAAAAPGVPAADLVPNVLTALNLNQENPAVGIMAFQAGASGR